jgi:hypothetical protein
LCRQKRRRVQIAATPWSDISFIKPKAGYCNEPIHRTFKCRYRS